MHLCKLVDLSVLLHMVYIITRAVYSIIQTWNGIVYPRCNIRSMLLYVKCCCTVCKIGKLNNMQRCISSSLFVFVCFYTGIIIFLSKRQNSETWKHYYTKFEHLFVLCGLATPFDKSHQLSLICINTRVCVHGLGNALHVQLTMCIQ